MGISGKYVKTFAEANIASCVDIHMNSDYPHFFFDVLGTEVMVDGHPLVVKLKSHRNSTVFTFPVKKGKVNGYTTEYAEIEQSSSYERIFGQKPHKFKIIPMQGKRF